MYGAMGLTLIALIEIIAIMYVYGHKRFSEDIKEMTGVNPGLYWQLTWRFFAPVMLAGILVSSIFFHIKHHPTYSAWQQDIAKAVKKEFPGWALGVGSFLAVISIVPIVGVAVFRIIGWSKPHPTYQPGAPMKRVETNASTRPMIVNLIRNNYWQFFRFWNIFLIAGL